MKGLFTSLSLLYQGGCQIKNAFFDLQILKAKRAPFPVISIGNLVFGGSEKTPLAMALIGELLEQNHKPALITRGYRGRWERKGGVLSAGKGVLGTWEDAGDEAFMVALNFPKAGVFIGKERLTSCRSAYLHGFELAVCDDAFQHRKLYRDIDIVLYNPSEKNPLREPVTSLKRAHILLMKQNIDAKIRNATATRFPHLEAFTYSVSTEGFFCMDGMTREDVDSLRRKKLLAFCGIARPQRFMAQLASEDIHPCCFLQFPDHHAYPPATRNKILAALQRERAEVMITTEKDSVKIRDFAIFQEIPTFYLKIGIRTEQAFSERIKKLLKEKDGPLKKRTIKSDASSS